jgi:DNA mismatch repair protein MutS
MALVTEYFQLTKQYQTEYGPNTILLMQVGSFFEVYGNTSNDTKILEFSSICELNVVDKNTCVGNHKVSMAGFKDLQLEKYIKKIQEVGFTAVVYVQDESAKNTTRSLAGIFSPGTFFHTDSTVLTNSTTCIWIDLVQQSILLKGTFVVVGIANIDIYTGKTSIFQFKEYYINNPTTYDELERFISIYNPNEVIIISNLPNENEIDYIINYSGITSNLIHKIHIPTISNTSNTKYTQIINCQKQTYQKEILSTFYKFDDFNVFYQNFYENNIATQSFCYLLDFIYKHNPHLVRKINEPIFENCSTRLILANHSLKQLNIINDNTIKSNKLSSVSQMLNNCLTSMGKRKFLYNLLNPVWDETYLQREYDITEHFLTTYSNSNSEIDTFFKNNLSTIKDLSKWERQIFLNKISPKSISNLYYNILTIQQIYLKISTDSILTSYFSLFDKNMCDILSFCTDISTFIHTNLNLLLSKDIEQFKNFEINFINSGIDTDLDLKNSILLESELKLEAIKNYLSSLIANKEKNNKSNDFVKIHETEKNNFTLLCTNRRCKLLVEALPIKETIVLLNYTINTQNKQFEFTISKTLFKYDSQTSSNNSIIDSQIHTLCKNISLAKTSIKDIITSVFNKFILQFQLYQSQLETIIHFITLIDILYTKSSIATKYNYCKPHIVQNNKSFVDAKQLRHCLIERFQSNELYICNDIVLGNTNVDGMLLYGTNAVGKTSLIKALGISIIMAQAGLYVPCSQFNFKPYKYLFTRIIGNDNIFKGLSTFAVEMSELRTILRLTNENSLILGDELCSGTETHSAVSIFVAGIQQLHHSNSSFIFATHLHEIVNYTEITSLDTLVLKHMEVFYDKHNDTLIYDRKLKDGPGNSMYGLEVCKSLNLPQTFLDAAYEIRLKYHPETRSILSLKTSQYNSNKIINICEKCNINFGTEVHHLQHQSNANITGTINTADSIFHKNNLANLMTLCEDCHNLIHTISKKGSKKIKTTKGTRLQEI